MHPYIPHTDADIQHMLETIGVETIDALFNDIDANIRVDGLNLPAQQSEREILNKMTEISMKNIDTSNWLNFVGGGIYEHLIPTIIPALLSRQEFFTAYTPYQPEISQGTLQAIFEYQTMICELTGLEVANASHYDGSTALAEAAFMACSATRRNKVLVAGTLPKESLSILSTYLDYKDLELVVLEPSEGTMDKADVLRHIDNKTAAYIVATPNYFGLLEELDGISDALHANKSMLIVMTNPMSLSIYKSPGEWGADIAVGDGQAFGNCMNYGGPSLGFIACTKKLMRKMPGRIVGETLDIDGKRGYVLTLQAREQHIRREKATSNITSNQALNALAATIYMSTLGLRGLKEVATRSRINAIYLQQSLSEITGVQMMYNSEGYNEFVIKVPNVQKYLSAMTDHQIIAGMIISEEENLLLVSTTEIHTKDDLDTYIKAASEVLN